MSMMHILIPLKGYARAINDDELEVMKKDGRVKCLDPVNRQWREIVPPAQTYTTRDMSAEPKPRRRRQPRKAPDGSAKAELS